MATIPELLLKPESLSNIMELAERAELIMNAVRGALLKPDTEKAPPTFNATQLASLCNVDRNQIVHRLNKRDLPTGQLNSSANRRTFTLAESLEWVRTYRAKALRPEGADAVCISVANFKGGVGKTTTCMTLAQGLSLRGHRVLVVDTDPQGSLTTLFGKLPATDIAEEHTILPVCTGASESVSDAIMPTYWDGIDLIGAAPLLFAAEFTLPARQMEDPAFAFWDVLNVALDQARQEYDVILIDTPPALSYVTINALMASDGIVMPLPPSALAVASASQFWHLFSDLSAQLVEKRGITKEFDFVRILLTRVKSKSLDDASAAVKEWIQKTYEGKVLTAEIPETKVAESSAAEFGTVYDSDRTDVDPRTYKRALTAYDQATEQIEDLVRASWRRQLTNS